MSSSSRTQRLGPVSCVCFVPPRPDGLVYECRIWDSGEVETRPDNWHDFFNALVWLSFPQTKIAVSAAHMRAMQTPGEARGTTRDALTHFDECGIAVLSTRPELLDLLRGCGDTPVVLLHSYPYEREAGYLAQAFNNVYLDGGLSINHLGARSPAFIARLLELAPFRKILYSSDGFGPPELHYLGSALWRKGIGAVLGDFVGRGDWSEADAIRVADLIGRDNARRVYALAG